jgi:GNAT superfamily N-acetyltransferase
MLRFNRLKLGKISDTLRSQMIRVGRKEDLPRVLELITELAIFEREPDAVINTVAMMERDGFGDKPMYGFYVAEVDNQIVGLSIFYYRYSTWKGPCLYLEDLIVTESMRGKGHGKELFEITLEHAKKEKLNHVMWQVLDWNKSAIDFYEKYGATLDGEWINCKIDTN